MKRYSKPLGRLLDFKQDFFELNDSKLQQFEAIASLYKTQPLRLACKNCSHPLNFLPSECFTKLGIEYCFCVRCGHLNARYEDTEAFCRAIYTDDGGKNYAKGYSATDTQNYKDRVGEIYMPKAEFLVEALTEARESHLELSDFGAGAGYFVSAAMTCGFKNVIGYEPSETLVNLGNTMIGSKRLIAHDLSEIVDLLDNCSSSIVSFIGVLEHLQNPREVLNALSQNDNIKYVFLSVPPNEQEMAINFYEKNLNRNCSVGSIDKTIFSCISAKNEMTMHQTRLLPSRFVRNA